MAGVEYLSVTWMMFVFAINISTCTLFMQGRSVEQCALSVQHNNVLDELKSNTSVPQHYSSSNTKRPEFNYRNICEGQGCSGNQNNHRDLVKLNWAKNKSSDHLKQAKGESLIPKSFLNT